MTQVNAIKHANRCHGVAMGIKIRNLAVHTHGQEKSVWLDFGEIEFLFS